MVKKMQIVISNGQVMSFLAVFNHLRHVVRGDACDYFVFFRNVVIIFLEDFEFTSTVPFPFDIFCIYI